MKSIHCLTASIMGAALACGLGIATTPVSAQALQTVDVVVGNNFGHLPMFVGVEKGLFKKHGLDV